MILIICNVTFAKLFQYLAPIVLGIISVITRINTVSIPDITPNGIFSNNFVASAPTPAAPIV